MYLYLYLYSLRCLFIVDFGTDMSSRESLASRHVVQSCFLFFSIKERILPPSTLIIFCGLAGLLILYIYLGFLLSVPLTHFWITGSTLGTRLRPFICLIPASLFSWSNMEILKTLFLWHVCESGWLDWKHTPLCHIVPSSFSTLFSFFLTFVIFSVK